MIAEFTIHAPPTGKARPRVTMHGTYTPKKTKDYERLVQAEYLQQCSAMYFGSEALSVSVDAYYSIPKSVSKKKAAQMTAQFELPKKKPDLDNLCKAIFDALNGIAYDDDAQIVCITAKKMYSQDPRCEVRISET